MLMAGFSMTFFVAVIIFGMATLLRDEKVERI